METGGNSRRRSRDQTKKKNEKRLGGKALSLHSFANAKSMSSSGYNPSIIKKQREFYKNAKYVSKFKKSIKQECPAEIHPPAAARLEDLNENENERRPSMKRKKKKKSSLQDLKEEIEKKQVEAEKAKMERAAMIEAKQEERAKAEARRKAQRDKMLKKTRSGQPVMKYRIENILQGLLAEDSAS